MVSSTVDFLFNLLNNYYDNLIPGNRSEIPFKKEFNQNLLRGKFIPKLKLNPMWISLEL